VPAYDLLLLLLRLAAAGSLWLHQRLWASGACPAHCWLLQHLQMQHQLGLQLQAVAPHA
jgi:hypothetical protein